MLSNDKDIHVLLKIDTLIINEKLKNNYFRKEKENVQNRVRKTQQQLENVRHNR